MPTHSRCSSVQVLNPLSCFLPKHIGKYRNLAANNNICIVLPEEDSDSRLGAWDDPVFDCVFKEELVALPAGAVEVLVYPKS